MKAYWLQDSYFRKKGIFGTKIGDKPTPLQVLQVISRLLQVIDTSRDSILPRLNVQSITIKIED